MAGNKLGAIKAKTGFGKKGYKPGAMVAKMNAAKKAAVTKKVAVKKTAKK